ncbi:MAG: hypothetical protein NTX64_13605 [Elusimicrobia bacterium]|nr:hypothetical protein [Elusimicrobiota bacterium]
MRPKTPTQIAVIDALAVLAAAALLLLYLLLPDKVYVFDGVMFSYIIERRVVDLGAMLFNRRHLLFIPSMMCLRDGLAALGLPTAAYPLVQKVNACAGALGVWLFYRMSLRRTADKTVSLLGAAILGLSYAYASRATEGQVYMLMSLGALASLSAAWRLLDDEGPGPVAVLAAALACALLFHAANIALLPMGAVALWLAAPRVGGPDPGLGAAAPPALRLRRAGALLAAAALVGAAFAWAFGVRGPASLLAFLWKATEFTPKAGGGWWELTGDLFAHGGSGLGSRLASSLRETGQSLAALNDAPTAAAVIGTAMLAGVALAWRLTWERLEARERKAGLIAAALWLGFAALNNLWGGGIFFGPPPFAALLALAAIAGARLVPSGSARRSAALTAVSAGILALGAWNIGAGLAPQSRIENNDGYRRAIFIKEHTFPTGWVLTSGLGFGNSKVYITEFAHRSSQVLEYYVNPGGKAQGLARFGDFTRSALAHGLPVYATSDLVDDAKVLGEIRRLWGVTPDEVRACFGPGTFLPVAAYDDRLRLYLFRPVQPVEPFLAGLAFNALDAADTARADEALALFERSAAAASKGQRSATASLLRTSNFGARLLFEGMAPFLDEAARRGGAAYAAAFLRSPTPAQRARLERLAAALR